MSQKYIIKRILESGIQFYEGELHFKNVTDLNIYIRPESASPFRMDVMTSKGRRYTELSRDRGLEIEQALQSWHYNRKRAQEQ